MFCLSQGRWHMYNKQLILFVHYNQIEPAEQQEQLLYASVQFSKSQPVSSKTKKYQETVEYAAVTFKSARTEPRWAAPHTATRIMYIRLAILSISWPLFKSFALTPYLQKLLSFISLSDPDVRNLPRIQLQCTAWSTNAAENSGSLVYFPSMVFIYF